ncbi:NmrA-like family-domain-containing protein [Bisporella sp. PMI_857]|nr:NmrA-like family-domain-containing protein [Bisporella sp. PMI_857]
MPSATKRSALEIRSRPQPVEAPPPRRLKHAPCTSISESDLFSVQSPYVSHIEERPYKRPMPTPNLTIAVVNSSGRQAASFIRVASAVGYKVRAQLRNLDGIVANEISSLPNVKVIVGDLYTRPSSGPKGVNTALIKDLFRGADLAFINTTFWGDEVAIGKALADAAARADIKHYVYSSMPDHSLANEDWPSLPLWSAKFEVEQYIRTLPTLAPRTTFLYTGIYNNNFTSLPYPLFCMELQKDRSFVWEAPFHPDVPLPWLDAEHDVGPAVLQLFKDEKKWAGQKIALAYEMLSPIEACRVFSKGVGRRVRYKHKDTIDVKVKIPTGYREQLLALEKLYAIGKDDPSKQPPYFGTHYFESSCPEEAFALWEGYRGLEEYAKEVFPLEEAANGLKWMDEEEEVPEKEKEDESSGDDESEGLTIGGTDTPARKEETWLA